MLIGMRNYQSSKIKWKLLNFQNKSKLAFWKLPIFENCNFVNCQFCKIAILENCNFGNWSIFNFVTSQNFFRNFVWKFSYGLLTLCLCLSLIIFSKPLSAIIAASDRNAYRIIGTLFMRHPIWNWLCPTYWNCQKNFYLFSILFRHFQAWGGTKHFRYFQTRF